MKDSKANRLGNYIFSKKTIDKMNDKIILYESISLIRLFNLILRMSLKKYKV